jgi:hypothetical protein
MTGNKGVSNHAKASCRLVKTIPVFLIAFLFPKVTTALKGKRFQDAEDIKKNVTANLNALPLEAFAEFSKPATQVFKLAEILRIEIKQLLISVYFLFLFPRQSGNFIARPTHCINCVK